MSNPDLNEITLITVTIYNRKDKKIDVVLHHQQFYIFFKITYQDYFFPTNFKLNGLSTPIFEMLYPDKLVAYEDHQMLNYAIIFVSTI